MDAKDRLIASLMEENLVLKARLLDLERRLGLNSGTSSKPPSSDGLRKKPVPQSLRQKGKNLSGGQAGHKGETLKQCAHPDQINTHTLSNCSICGESLSDKVVESVVKRQVFDITPPAVVVTEHQAEVKICQCGHVNMFFPSGIKAPVQYGCRTKALAVYLSVQQLIPEDRLQQLFADIFTLPIATGTLTSMNLDAARRVENIREQVLAELKASDVKHLDETSLRIGGKTWWLHVISNAVSTHYRVSSKRGELLDDVRGIVVHDHWKPYFTMKNVKHALCNAHHLRELKALEEIEKEPWAFKMSKLLRILSRFEIPPPEPIVARIIGLYDKIVAEGIGFHEAQGAVSSRKNKRRVGHNLLLRLQNFKTETLRFLINPDVPFTNNQAEQDIRMMKVKQKISGSFRTEKGAQTFCTIRSFLSTNRKQGNNLFQAINTAFA